MNYKESQMDEKYRQNFGGGRGIQFVKIIIGYLNLLLRKSLHVTAAERCECTSHPSRLSCGTASSAQCPEG